MIVALGFLLNGKIVIGGVMCKVLPIFFLLSRYFLFNCCSVGRTTCWQNEMDLTFISISTKVPWKPNSILLLGYRDEAIEFRHCSKII